jgi:asparagine synthase (glutamine-hydrolysing)
MVMARFARPQPDWSGPGQAWRWPALGVDRPAPRTLDLSATLKLAWTGDAVCEPTAGGRRLLLAQSFGALEPAAAIEAGGRGYHGRFALIEAEAASGTLRACTDPMRQIALYCLDSPQAVAIATDLRLLAQLPGWTPALSAAAIYHHLNFSYIPTPFTIYEQVTKLPPGARLVADAAGVRIERYWQPSYPEDLVGSEGELAERLRVGIEAAIGAFVSPEEDPACFLSGGTDSSTIAGVLARKAGPARVHAFSIGFAEKAFDELEFALTAARAFGVDHHHRRIDAAETLAAVELLVDTYDEPFGNSSAVPTYYCADLARRQGCATLLGGDGGDEIFGGNERYAKDYYFQRYHRLPAPIKAVGGLLRHCLRPIDRRLTNKVCNFLHRGALANPERFYTDDSFASDFYEELLAPGFRAANPQRSSLAILEGHFAACDARSELNRLMYIDLQMAIADNDLTKVNRAAKAAGIAVAYPYLSVDLVELMGRMPAILKVKGAAKRYLFKQATRNVLPEAIRNKKKQGFGLPVGHWFRHDPAIRAFLYDTLLSARSLERGYFQKPFVRSLLARHEKAVWDYSNELWLLLMLELWHRHHFDALAVRSHAA